MNILLITSFFPPLNNIASSRMASFKKYLETKGCEVDVITRYYSEEQNSGDNLLVGYQKANNFLLDYIEKEGVYYTNYDSENKKLNIFNKLPRGIRGLYSYLNTDIYQHGWLKYVLAVFEEKLSDKKYDFIIASHAPAIAFEAASIISKKYSIPWIADYRDLFIDFKPNPLALALKIYRQHCLLKGASGVVFVSPGMKDFFNRFATSKLKVIPSEIVYNGFDNEAYSGNYDPADKHVIDEFESIKDKFDIILMHSGSLYKGRNIDFFVNVVSKFNGKNKLRLGIVLLGLSKNNFDQKVNKFCFVLPRVSVNTSFYLEQKADVLLMPIYKDLYTGFSGKVFEYLYSENIVFYDSNPHEDLRVLLKDFSKCIEIKNYETFASEIAKLHDKKNNNSQLDSILKERLTRKHSVDLLFKFLKKINHTVQ